MSAIRVTSLSSICRQNEYIIIQPTFGQESCIYITDCHRLATGESQERGGGGGGELVDFYDGGDHVNFGVWNLGKANIFGIWDFEDWKQIFVV